MPLLSLTNTQDPTANSCKSCVLKFLTQFAVNESPLCSAVVVTVVGVLWNPKHFRGVAFATSNENMP